ncbi:MAG: DUF2189 domain-containing protein [Burkholderiales bacterium]|nr:DUF2189 domain-containing protein [Burkholderiales bacterium]
MNDVARTPLRVRKVHPLRALIWLRRGWHDFMNAPDIGLLHGVAASAIGGLMLWLAWDKFWWLAGVFSGFLLVAPGLSTGLYAVSRAIQRGEPVSWATVWKVWTGFDRRLATFGLLLMLAGTVWVLTSAAFITLSVHPPVTTPMDFLQRVVLSPRSAVFETWLMLGGLMVAPVFASSAVSIPLMMDRRVGVLRAVLTSWRAVMLNPAPLALWAAIVMGLTLLGLGTLMFGLVLVVPVLGHARWHAYRDLVVRENV